MDFTLHTVHTAVISLLHCTLQVHNPRNTVSVELYFRGEKMAKVMGSLAMKKPEEGMPVSGEASGIEGGDNCNDCAGILVQNLDMLSCNNCVLVRICDMLRCNNCVRVHN